MRRNRRFLRIAIVLVVALVPVILAGCGGQTRSTAAFCSTMHSEQRQILAQMHTTASGGGNDSLARAFSEIGASVQAIGALRTYFDELSDVAPTPIEDDAKIVAQSYNQEFNEMGNGLSDPLGSLLGELMDSIGTSSQLDAMNQFALQNCGSSV